MSKTTYARAIHMAVEQAMAAPQAVLLVGVFALVTGYINWALSLVAGALFVPFVCRRNPQADLRVLVAAAYGLDAIDVPYMAVKDLDGLEEDAARAQDHAHWRRVSTATNPATHRSRARPSQTSASRLRGHTFRHRRNH